MTLAAYGDNNGGFDPVVGDDVVGDDEGRGTEEASASKTSKKVEQLQSAIHSMNESMQSLVEMEARRSRREAMTAAQEPKSRSMWDEGTKAISRSHRFLVALSLHSLFEYIIKYHVEVREIDEFSSRMAYVIGVLLLSWVMTKLSS